MFGIDDLAIGSLLTVLRKYWLHILIAVAVAAWHGVVYWAGGSGPRAELEKERAERAAAEERADFVDELSAEATEQSNKELTDEKSRINAKWAPLVNFQKKRAEDAARARDDLDRRLRDALGKQEPVRPTPGCPESGPGGDRLPDAVERYIAAERSREERERADASGLLQTCQVQAGTLKNSGEWARRQRLINEPPRP